PDSDAARFKGVIDAQLHLKAGELLGNGSHQLNVKVVTQDTGAEGVETVSESVTVNTNFDSGGGGGDPDTIQVTFGKNPDFVGTEDHPFTAAEAFTLDVESTGTADATFTLVLTLPKDSVVMKDGSPIASTRIGGDEEGEESAVWVITGTGDPDAFLESIKITPPEHLNDNDGGLQVDATLTAYLENGSQAQGDLVHTYSLKPVTDGAVVNITFSAADAEGKPTADPAQDGRDIAITLSVKVDVDTNSEFGKEAYIRLSESDGLSGGQLLDAEGNALTTITVGDANEQGLPAGTYFVAMLPEGETSVDIRYVPSDGQTYKAGNIAINAWVQSREQGAADDDWQTIKSSETGYREAVNNGVDFQVGEHDADTGRWVVTGNEAGKAIADNAITLDISSSNGGVAQLFDTDGSEQIVAAQLTGVPVGFLVYVDGKPASNAGGTGTTNNWLIPVSGSGDGLKLPEI